MGSSPRERGSSLAGRDCVWAPGVVPARAGVIPTTGTRVPSTRRRPRASGGHPGDHRRAIAAAPSSPRERGSSRPRRGCDRCRRVVPARAGVIRLLSPPSRPSSRRPRASGGHPDARIALNAQVESSPRERGSSVRTQHGYRQRAVVPARAGVIPARSRCCTARSGRPRASGGHPWSARIFRPTGASSPRERGSSCRPSRPCCRRRVVPARAGVIRHPPRVGRP